MRSRRRHAMALGGILFVLFRAGPAIAALFGTQPDAGRIVEVDPTTGAVLRDFAAPDPAFTEVGFSGAEDGSVLIWRSSTGSTSIDRVTRIDPITGNVISYETPISAFGAEVRGLTSQQIGGVDYIISGGGSAPLTAQRGYSSTQYDELEVGSPVRSLGGDSFGRSFAACFDGTGTIREFDPTSGVVSNTFEFAPSVRGLAYDGQFLYAAGVTASGNTLIGTLHTLDPNTRAIVRSVTVDGGQLTGLGVAVPEPSSAVAALLATAITSLLGRRQRRPCLKGDVLPIIAAGGVFAYAKKAGMLK